MPYLRQNSFNQDNRIAALSFITSIYCRISPKGGNREKEEEVSLEIQQSDLEEARAKMGFRFYDLYRETVSGGVSFENRPDGKRLLKDAEEGKFNAILVWDNDRLGRSRDGIAQDMFRHRMRELGVQIYSLSQPNQLKTPEEFKDDPYDESQILMDKLHDWQSASTVTKFRRRSMRGKENRVRNGKMINTPPYGYKLEPLKDINGQIVIKKDGRVVYARVINESEAVIVVRVYHEYVYEGKSQNQIRDGLNADGIPTRKGRAWERAMVGRILKNPVYYGALIYNKSWRRKESLSGKSKWGHNPKEKWIVVSPKDTEHPEIVSKELFDEAQRIRQRKLKLGAVAVYSDFLLSGLVKCGVCGSIMHRKKVTSYYKRKSDGGVSKSQCNGYVCGRWERFKDTEKNYISEKDLKGAILGDLQKYKNNPNVLKGFLEENERKDLESTSKRLEMVRSNLTKVNDRYNRLLKAYELGRLPLEKFDEAVGNLNLEEGQMKDLIVELEEKILAESQREMGKKEFEKAIDNFESLFQSTDIKQQKRFLRELVDHVVAGEDQIRINYLIASA
jgi:site-specific DNA recombinase